MGESSEMTSTSELEKLKASSPQLERLISVVIPAKDEAGSIGSLLVGVKQALSGMPHEIIVVDDGSRDATAGIAKSNASKVISHKENHGKGTAMKTGVRAASGSIMVFLDADGAHDAKDIAVLIAPLLQKKADLVIGSRSLPGSRVGRSPFHRRFTNYLASVTISIIISLLLPVARLAGSIAGRARRIKHTQSSPQPRWRWSRITDCTSGFRAITREGWEKLNLTSRGFEIETEMLYEAAKNGLGIAEVPIACNWDSHLSRLSVFQDGLVTLKLLLSKLAGDARGR